MINCKSNKDSDNIVERFEEFLSDKNFPCVAAKAALKRKHIKFFVADHMACPKDDHSILQFLYNFVEEYRINKDESQFYSAVVIFKNPADISEKEFDALLWQRLQSFSDIDLENYSYDNRVSSNPSSENFSFSLMGEAFFVIGLNPGSSRFARSFKYPALVFNPHQQFEELRKNNQYEKLKNIVRKRDVNFSGSVNPTLANFGESSEVHQYSGMQHNAEWKCPLQINR